MHDPDGAGRIPTWLRTIGTAGICAALSALAPLGASATAPFPRCTDVVGCTDPYDYGSYLFNDPANLLGAPAESRIPDDLDPVGDGDAWKYLADTGLNIIEAWGLSTGRPDVVIAVLDSGIRWSTADLRRKTALNTDELPVPAGCAAPVSPSQLAHDCNGDGVVNIADFRDQVCPGGTVTDANGNANGLLDPQDLILLCSDGVDGWGGDASPVANGYADDIAGWDFFEDDNDPFDDTDFGHGTGEALDSTGEADNATGFPGVAPSAMSLPLRVGDAFVAVDSDFAQAVVYAVDYGAALIQEALGTISHSAAGQGAVDYAYASGVPIMASAADEESRHHNYPANYEHTIWLNSIRDSDGTIAETIGTESYDILNGCTNYGGKAWSAISSTSCSSEATGRGSGVAALLISHGRNLVDAGIIDAWDPATGTPYSAEEVRQLFRASADDVDRSDDLALGIDATIQTFLSKPPLGLSFGSSRFPTQAGWDQYTGYGRPDTLRLLELASGEIPPEADLSGGPLWFDVIDPGQTPEVDVIGSAFAERSGGWVEVSIQVGCGVQPTEYMEIGSDDSATGFDRDVLATWFPGVTAAMCGFDPAAPITEPDDHSVTLRMEVRDIEGRVGMDRRTVAIDTDPSLVFPPQVLGASGEGSPVLVDLDRNGVLDVLVGTGAGGIHAIAGGTGEPLPGFPTWTDFIAVHPSQAYEPTGPVPVPREALIASLAADDLDGDGRIEIVAASAEGKLYVFDDHGARRPGFPVSTDPALSAPANRDRFNDADPGLFAAPTLADLGGDEGLELIASAADGHLYAWRHDGTPVDGFPVRIADRSQVDVDLSTGKATPKAGVDAKERLTKLIGSPAVGDLDADGTPEIVVTSNEEYGGAAPFGTDSILVQILLSGSIDLGEDFTVDVAGRVYAVHADGNDHAGGPFVAGWPAQVPLLVSGLLPNVGTGTPGSAALADVDPSDDDDTLRVAIFGTAGPVVLLDETGSPVLGDDFFGNPNAMAVDFPDGGFFNTVPPSVGSPDGPFFGALGSGSFGDMDGDGAPEFAAPTGGIRKLIDVAAPGSQAFGDHQMTVWNPQTGGLYGPTPEAPVFPVFMDDMQFLSSPTLADVSGDGRADVVNGSGAYLVRAYTSDGVLADGFPKFTHGWMIGAPTVGDVTGDGLSEVAVLTREGRLFVWGTPGVSDEPAIQWQGFGRDRRNSGNLASGVPLTPRASTWEDGLSWDLRTLLAALDSFGDTDPDVAAVLAANDVAGDLAAAIEAFEGGESFAGAFDMLSANRGMLSPRWIRPATAALRKQLRNAGIEAVQRILSE